MATLNTDFEHFLAYSGLCTEPPEIQSKLRRAYEHGRNPNVIALSPAEIQSGSSRVKWAEDLIVQLPETHDGRNSWLLNYGAPLGVGDTVRLKSGGPDMLVTDTTVNNDGVGCSWDNARAAGRFPAACLTLVKRAAA